MLNAYADYGFYRDAYLGNKIPEQEFEAVALRATYYINAITFNRIDPENVLDNVKLAMCAVAEVVLKQDENGDKSSEKVGEYSVTYNTKGATEKKMYSAASPFLIHTGLLYRGV